jgi:hypothetical protein
MRHVVALGGEKSDHKTPLVQRWEDLPAEDAISEITQRLQVGDVQRSSS